MNKKIVYSIIVLSTICLLLLIQTHVTMYYDYSEAKGKNRALFGLTELLVYGYRHYYGIVPSIGFLVSLFISFRKENREIALVAALISLVATIFSVFSIWQMFI